MALNSNADLCLLNGLPPVISVFDLLLRFNFASELTTIPLNLYDRAWLANKEISFLSNLRVTIYTAYIVTCGKLNSKHMKPRILQNVLA